MKKILLFCILIFIVSLPVTGCARKVTGVTANPTLVVNVTFAGNVDIINYRYFLILNHDPSQLTGPDLLMDNKNINASLPFDGNTTPGSNGILDASTAPSFKYTDFYELSMSRGVTHGTVANSFNSTADPSVSITPSGANVTFSILLDPLVPFYQIQVVSTNAANFVVTDFLRSGISGNGNYQAISNIRGYVFNNAVNLGGASGAAYITNLTISVI